MADERHNVVAALRRMTPAFQEFFEERAAIMEYDGGLSREEAERLALACTRELYRRYGPDYGRPS